MCTADQHDQHFGPRPDPRIGLFHDAQPPADDVVYSRDPEDVLLDIRRIAERDVQRQRAAEAHHATRERTLTSLREQEPAAAPARARDADDRGRRERRSASAAPDGMGYAVAHEQAPVPPGREPVGLADRSVGETVGGARQPPWLHLGPIPRRGSALYVTLPGGRDEPPSTLCTGCGQVGGAHRARCAVEAYEADEHARWTDAQREAGNPALDLWSDVWADEVAGEDPSLPPTAPPSGP